MFFIYFLFFIFYLVPSSEDLLWSLFQSSLHILHTNHAGPSAWADILTSGKPSVNKIDLQALTLAGPTDTRPVPDP